MTSIAYLNGAWLPLAEAKVSVMDRGFLLADGVYEVLPAYGGRVFEWDRHRRRLERSLAAVRMAPPLAADAWPALLARLVRENGGGDLLIYLQVTRGAPERRGHPFPADAPPTVVAFAWPLALPSAAALAAGVGAITVPDTRWQRCDIKAIALLPNLLATQQAAERNCNEALLVRDGNVSEGASSNVFAVSGGRVTTPPAGPQILAGITRELLLEILPAAGIACAEDTLSESALRAADEIWVTSSSREILPVTTLDDRPVGGGKPGPLFARAHAAFQEFKTAA